MPVELSAAPSHRGRILVVAPQPFYEDRGTPIAVRQVLEALSQLGYEADVLTFPVGSAVEIPGIRLYRIANPFRVRRVPIGFSVRKLVLDAGLVVALERHLRRSRYFCVHAVEEAAFPAVWLGRRYGVPVIYDMQSSLPEQLMLRAPFRSRFAAALLRECERWLLRSADVVVSSAGLAERVRATIPGARVREWRYSSLPPAALPEDGMALRRELGIPPRAPVVLYSGSFEPYQGLRELVAAIPAVRSQVQSAVFVLVGAQGANSLAIEEQAAGLIQSGAVRLIDRQPRHRIPCFFAMADVLVSPRAYGGNLPLKVFDYLATGLPIVATDIPTHRALLSEDRAVLVAPSAHALGQAIVDLIREPVHAARLGAAARSYAEKHLGWMAFVHSVRELYADAGARARNGYASG